MPIPSRFLPPSPIAGRPEWKAHSILRLSAPRLSVTLLLLSACGGEATDPPPSEPAGAVLEEWQVPQEGAAGEPWLSSSEDGVLMSWLETSVEGHALRVGRVEEGGVVRAGVAVDASDLFVNWADMPSAVMAADGSWLVHYLERGGQGTYDYAIRTRRSVDGGRSWSEPLTPHTDSTPTEHGFVSIHPTHEGDAEYVWLDGRRFAAGAHGEGVREMTLRHRTLGPEGNWGSEAVLDSLVCDCCQTGMAATARGWAVAYRNRTPGEIRDIYVGRMEDGVWIPGAAVHDDGWVMPACPVNGPAIAARGDDVVVAWFTAADSMPRVQVAFSGDGGATFGPPTRVDQGQALGRTDVVLAGDGSAWVVWLEDASDGAEIRMRRVRADGEAAPWTTLVETERARASGFPRLAPWHDGGLLLTWTEPSDEGSRVRLARVLPETGTPAGDVDGR